MTEDNFTIRKASPADLTRIHGIYAAARQFMRDHGTVSYTHLTLPTKRIV